MQAQSIRQSSVTINQSLQVVQTLLRAGFGCITYLRGLLPDENFTESHLNSSSGISPASSQESSCTHSTSVKLKTVKKGWSTEGDRLLQYLEKGIFDALEKQYLRSFIFAIYLDENNPENVVETYTFNFSYRNVPGVLEKVPIMTLNDQFDGLSFTKSKNRDPVARAINQGKQPTLSEVKQSVKYLIRTLIAAVQTLNALPSRRFATFKLFYTDNVPDDYEPPYFCRGDPEKPYVFCTNSSEEVPESINVGFLRTPYHCLNICVDSISDIIPHCEDDDNQCGAPRQTCEGAMKSQKAERLPGKAVWNAEYAANSPSDTQFQKPPLLNPSDDDWQQTRSGRESKSRSSDSGHNEVIVSLEKSCFPSPMSSVLLPTQILEANDLTTPQAMFPHITDTLNGMDVSMDQSCEVSTQTLTEFLLKRDTNVQSPIVSQGEIAKGLQNPPFGAQALPADFFSTPTRSREDVDSQIECDCGVDDNEADICQCEGPCKKWFHIWCIGYHSVHDKRLPAVYWCFSCRLRNEPEIEILDSKNLTSQYVARHKDLCLFRRAIKIVLTHRPENVSTFTGFLGTEISTAAQTWKRLEVEGFIVPETHQEVLANKTQKSKRVIKRYKYTPADEIESSKKYKEYFDVAKETLLIGMSKLHLREQTTNKTEQKAVLKTRGQTNSVPDNQVNKRKNDNYEKLSKKRIKISIAEAIKLQE